MTTGEDPGSAIRRWPLIGREAELQRIHDTIERGDSVIIAGEPGVGKTRLARTALLAAVDSGWRIEWCVASLAAASIPFAALASMLPTDALGGDSLDLLGTIVKTLESQRSDRRLVVGVDDAHLLDTASAALLGMLADTDWACVVATVRSGEQVTDALRNLSKGDAGIRLDLQTLSPLETARVLELALDGQVEGSTVHQLYEMTGGNMLYLRELVVGGLSLGALRRRHGLWTWKGTVSPNATLVQLLNDRMSGLDRDDVRTMLTMATSGAIELDLVSGIVAGSSLRLLEERGLVESFRQRETVLMRVAHPLYGEVIAGQSSPLQIQEVHLALAEALERRGIFTDEDALQFVRWSVNAGESPKPSLLIRAAQRLIALSDPVAAEEVARLAVECGGGFDAELLLGRTLQMQGRVEDADRLLSAIDPQTDEQRVARALAIAEGRMFLLGQADRAAAALSEAEELVSTPDLRGQLTAFRAVIAMATGQLEEALSISVPLLRTTRDDHTRVRLSLTSVTSWALTGRFAEAVEESAAIAATARALTPELPWALPQFSGARILALLGSGQLTALVDECRSGYQRALTSGDAESLAVFATGLGMAYIEVGRADLARRWLHEGIAISRKHGLLWTRSGLLYLACAQALSGDHEGAVESLEAAEPMTIGVPAFYGSEHLRARATVLAASGETTAARDSALSATDVASDGGAWTLAAFALHDAVRWGVGPAAHDRFVEIGPRVSGDLAPAMADHARGLAEDDPDLLDTVSRSFEAMGLLLYAAEAAAEAATLYSLGRQTLEATEAEQRATSLFALCSCVATPALLRLPKNPLTPREQEVASLAARGLSDRDIAERLYLSVRTIHSHLRSVYAKLGIASRDELIGRLD